MSRLLRHTVTWTIACGELRTEFGCAAPHGAACRLFCPADCSMPADCPTDGPDAARHRPVDAGRCLGVEWLEEGCLAEELYDGPPVPLRSGPIVLEWDGDTWTWRYAEL